MAYLSSQVLVARINYLPSIDILGVLTYIFGASTAYSLGPSTLGDNNSMGLGRFACNIARKIIFIGVLSTLITSIGMLLNHQFTHAQDVIIDIQHITTHRAGALLPIYCTMILKLSWWVVFGQDNYPAE